MMGHGLWNNTRQSNTIFISYTSENRFERGWKALNTCRRSSLDQSFPLGPYRVYFELLAWVVKCNAIFHNAFDNEKTQLTSISTSRWRTRLFVKRRASAPYGSPGRLLPTPPGAWRGALGQLIPANKNVMRQVSLGMKSLNLDPDATYSTTASVLPARCRKGRNPFAFPTSCYDESTIYWISRSDVTYHTGLSLLIL